MQHHIFNRGDGQCGVWIEADCPVPDEAHAVAMVARQMVLGWRLPQPQPVVFGCAGAGEPRVVPDGRNESRVGIWPHKNAAPGLGDTAIRQACNVRPGVSGAEQLGGTGNPAGLFEVFEDVHGAISGRRDWIWKTEQAVCG